MTVSTATIEEATERYLPASLLNSFVQEVESAMALPDPDSAPFSAPLKLAFDHVTTVPTFEDGDPIDSEVEDDSIGIRELIKIGLADTFGELSWQHILTLYVSAETLAEDAEDAQSVAASALFAHRDFLDELDLAFSKYAQQDPFSADIHETVFARQLLSDPADREPTPVDQLFAAVAPGFTLTVDQAELVGADYPPEFLASVGNIVSIAIEKAGLTVDEDNEDTKAVTD